VCERLLQELPSSQVELGAERRRERYKTISATETFRLEVFCRELAPTTLSNLPTALDYSKHHPPAHRRAPFPLFALFLHLSPTSASSPTTPKYRCRAPLLDPMSGSGDLSHCCDPVMRPTFGVLLRDPRPTPLLRKLLRQFRVGSLPFLHQDQSTSRPGCCGRCCTSSSIILLLRQLARSGDIPSVQRHIRGPQQPTDTAMSSRYRDWPN